MSLALAMEPRMRSPSEPERRHRMVAVDLDADAPESSVSKTFQHPLVDRAVFWEETDPEWFVH